MFALDTADAGRATAGELEVGDLTEGRNHRFDAKAVNAAGGSILHASPQDQRHETTIGEGLIAIGVD